MNKDLGNYIKENREKIGISQRELARRINISNKSINNIEKGLVNEVSLHILIDLANELKLNLEKLLRLNNYSNDEINEIFNIRTPYYTENFLVNYFNDPIEINEYTTEDYDMDFIDIVKVLDAYKHNKIDKEKAVALITACKPIIKDNKIIYITQNGDIEIETYY